MHERWCAGWLAFVDVGSATAPIYAAHDSGIPVHVYVDETRPRNQGASLTAWELQVPSSNASLPQPTTEDEVVVTSVFHVRAASPGVLQFWSLQVSLS